MPAMLSPSVSFTPPLGDSELASYYDFVGVNGATDSGAHGNNCAIREAL